MENKNLIELADNYLKQSGYENYNFRLLFTSILTGFYEFVNNIENEVIVPEKQLKNPCVNCGKKKEAVECDLCAECLPF